MSENLVQPLPAGSLIEDRYEILGCLSTDQDKAVYRAKHIKTSKEVAIKILLAHDNKVLLQRFQEEAKLLARLYSPNIVRCHDVGLTPEHLPYLVMDFIEGVSLDKIIEREGTLPPQRIRELFSQVCGALKEVHQHKIIHRDLRPANFLISKTKDGKELLTLTGFSVAQGEQEVFTGEIFGSPDYISPEQAMGLEVDPRCDIYALGCSLFACLTGSPPFQSASIEQTMTRQISEEPDLTLPESPDYAQLKLVVLRCLKKEPAARFKSTEELKTALGGNLVKTKPSVFLRGFR
jgi:serine/threonine-protein kinase